MSKYVIEDTTLSSIADAIRAKTGKTDTMTPEQMPTEIAGITTGGGSSEDVRYVTFMNGDVVLYKKPVAVGDDCVDVLTKGLIETPTKESTAQYDYTYYGWGASDNGAADSTILQNITEDKTVYAVFTATVRYYTITYYDSDGTTVLNTESLPYGSTPSYTPTKDGAVFDGWSTEITAVTGDASYIATWMEIIGGSLGDNCTWQLDASTGVLTVSGSGAMTDYDYSSNYSPIYEVKDSVVSVVIEDGVTSIGAAVFYECANLEDVTIPDSVTSIGNYAFRSCSSLEAVKIPDSVTDVGTGAFYSSGLTSITIPALNSVPNALCGSCSKLTNIVFHESNRYIGDSAFMGCTSLKAVTIPIGIARIGKRVFRNCTNLTTAVSEYTGSWKVTSTGSSSATAVTYVSLTEASGAEYLVTAYPEYYFHNTSA